MASLTHVCMWTDKGWKRITAEEASKLHPGGTVSAHSGLFMCELCGQYVSLTKDSVQTRHFRHSPHEKNKDCPERLYEPNHRFSYNAREHELPIRITNVSSSSFRFEVGLIRVPSKLLSEDLRIEIKPQNLQEKSFLYTRERLNDDRLTYLSIGEKPFEKYRINLSNADKELYEFWPRELNGINPEGTLFEKDSGRKLVLDADVEIDKEYYLLIQNALKWTPDKNIHIKKICRKKWGKKTWTLYLVSASTLSEKAARFYLEFHCRLTDHPVSINPIWPLYIEGDYLIKHSRDPIYISAEGSLEKVTVFPSAKIRSLNKATQPKVYEIECSSRQQLISTGRNRVLQYTYFWNEPLDRAGCAPSISVKDLDGNEIHPGETNILPRKKTLQFHSAFDGNIIVFRNERIVDKRGLSADLSTVLNDLSYDMKIQVLVGLDIIWQINFKKPNPHQNNNEQLILKQLSNVSGPYITVPHSLGNMMQGLRQFPLICQWIRKCIKSGVIKEKSYRRLQDFYRNNNSN